VTAIIGYVVAGLTFGYLAHLFAGRLRYECNGNAFHAQIHKLIMANNIDRAIRLCSADPRMVLAGLTKSLLVMANRAESLELYYQAAIVKTRGLAARQRKSTLLLLILFAALFAVSVVPRPGPDSLEPGWGYLFAVLFMAGARCSEYKWNNHLHLVEMKLVDIRNLLYTRARWLPPHLKPERRMTSEELVEWKTKLDALGKDAKKRGKSAREVYDDVVDPKKEPPEALPDLDL